MFPLEIQKVLLRDIPPAGFDIFERKFPHLIDEIKRMKQMKLSILKASVHQARDEMIVIATSSSLSDEDKKKLAQAKHVEIRKYVKDWMTLYQANQFTDGNFFDSMKMSINIY